LKSLQPAPLLNFIVRRRRQAMETLNDNFDSDIEVDPAPYGIALAERVADHLTAGREIAYSHRDYCGMGLFFSRGGFEYSAVADGYPSSSDDNRSFSNREAFVAWLAQQSDVTLFNQGNQGISRARLEDELAKAGE